MGRPAPSYWWDFKHSDDNQITVIVQSDYEGGEQLDEFECGSQCHISGYCEGVTKALNAIKAYEEGRKTPNFKKRNK